MLLCSINLLTESNLFLQGRHSKYDRAILAAVMFINKTFQIETVFRELKWWSLCLKHPVGSSYSLITIYNQDSPIDEILSQIAEWLLCVPATIFFHDTIRISIQLSRYDTRYDTLHITTKRLVSCLWAQKSVQLTSLVGSTHAFIVPAILNMSGRRVSTNWRQCFPMFVDAFVNVS